jgi:hypothetical protein
LTVTDGVARIGGDRLSLGAPQPLRDTSMRNPPRLTTALPGSITTSSPRMPPNST